jgi:CarD family transcriptional regulator
MTGSTHSHGKSAKHGSAGTSTHAIQTKEPAKESARTETRSRHPEHAAKLARAQQAHSEAGSGTGARPAARPAGKRDVAVPKPLPEAVRKEVAKPHSAPTAAKPKPARDLPAPLHEKRVTEKTEDPKNTTQPAQEKPVPVDEFTGDNASEEAMAQAAEDEAEKAAAAAEPEPEEEDEAEAPAAAAVPQAPPRLTPAPRPPSKPEIFVEGDHVVYPTHGVGKVERIATEEIAGHKLELIHITFEENRMTLRVPVTKARSAGLRKLATRKSFDEALAVLKGRARIKRTMWSRRAQEYEAKINSGDPMAIAEVVRDLHRNAGQPDQSFSERQIYEAAMDRLAAELAALDKTDKAVAAQKLAEFLKTI